MFWRTAIILTLITQPALSLVGALCGREVAAVTVSEATCCCCDASCPASCPCIEENDTPDGPPVTPTPATLPAQDHLLVLLSQSVTVVTIVEPDEMTMPSEGLASGTDTTSRALRTRIGIWRT